MTEIPAPRRDNLERLTQRQRDLYDAVVGVSPPRSLVDAGKLIGLKKQSAQNAWGRIREVLWYDPRQDFKALGKLRGKNQHTPEVEPLRAISPEVLARKVEMRANSILDAMSPAKIEEADLAQLSRALRDLLDKRAQLRGEPSQIMSVEHRHTLMEIMPAMVREAQRRGYTFVTGPNGEVNQVRKLTAGEKAAAIDIEPAEAVPAPHSD
jgi:hypothetical protein